MKTKQNKQPGVRYDNRTGQYFPTIDGIDASPTSFDEKRAMEIAEQICNAPQLTPPAGGE